MTTTESAIQKQIYTIIHELTAIAPSDITLDDDLRGDLGMDSVSSMELISMLSEEFDIDVDIEDAMQVVDVRGVIEMAQRYLANAT